MNCPFCGSSDNHVVDSRDVRDGAEVRRRRECDACSRRFTTYERVDELPVTVVKRDGRRESFDREKLLNGLLRACEKRPVPRRDLVGIVDSVESHIAAKDVREMSTEDIGNWVPTKLNPNRSMGLESQADRATNYIDAMTTLLAEPWLIGWHWCAYVENTARGWGIKDPWDEPYTDFIDPVGEFNRSVYDRLTR